MAERLSITALAAPAARRLRGAIRILLLAVMCAPFPALAGGQPVGGLEFFGDSNSDDGNAWRISGKIFPASPPFWEGRFGNGPVWPEILRDRLNIPADRYANHAVGGAYTGYGNRVSDVAPGTTLARVLQRTGMLAQAEAYLATGRKAAPDTLFVVWAGDNDYGNVDRVDPQAVERAIANIESTIRLLAKAGASQFLVANINEDLVFPEARAAGSQAWDKINAADHNARLAALIERMRNELGVPVTLFDTASVTGAIARDPARFGFTQVIEPCYAGPITEHGKPCADAGGYLFWDGDHLSHAAQKLIADKAAETIGGMTR